MNFISSSNRFLILIIFGKLTCDEARPMAIDHDQNSTIYCSCAIDWKKQKCLISCKNNSYICKALKYEFYYENMNGAFLIDFII